MTSRHDFPLPISDASPSANPWTDGKAQPTNLIVLHPGETAPSSQQVMAAISKQFKTPLEIIAEPKPEQPHTLWDVIFKAPGFAYPIGAWAEPMRPMSEDTIKHLGAQDIKWSVGLEAILNPSRAMAEFESLLRLAGRAFPDSPAILDVNKEGWHLREELNDIILPGKQTLIEALLWMVHAIGTDDPPKPESKTWLYTQGLERCGLPELEMIEVPYSQVGAAMGLLNGVAEQLVERGIPEPGEAFEVGADLMVTLQKLETVTPHVDEKSLGGHGNDGRHRTNHTGNVARNAAAVVCGAQPQGSYRKIWTWPAEVVQRVAITGSTALYRSQRAMQRQAQMARDTIDELAQVHQQLPAKFRQPGEERQTVFLIKASFARPEKNRKPDPHDDGREHLWFEIKQFKGGRVEAVLLNDPHSIEHLRKGDSAKLDRGSISDWQVLTKQGTFGPSNIDGLKIVVQQLCGAPIA